MRCVHGCRADERGVYHAEPCEGARLMTSDNSIRSPDDYSRGWRAALSAVRTFGVEALYDLEYDAALSAPPERTEVAGEQED